MLVARTLHLLRWVGQQLAMPVLVALAVSVAGLVTAPLIADRLEKPSCDQPLDLTLLKAADIEVTGESKPPDEFPKKGTVRYDATNLTDGNSATAWVEGTPDLGIGASVQLALPSGTDVRMVCVVDGYGESWDLYQRNSRVRLLQTRTDQGTRSAMLRDAGSQEHPAVYQQIDLAAGETDDLRLEIESAYGAQGSASGGQTYADTSLSEAEVWVSR